MIKIELMNTKTRRSFEKIFDSVKEARKFLTRCSYSLSILPIGLSCESEEVKQELMRYF